MNELMRPCRANRVALVCGRPNWHPSGTVAGPYTGMPVAAWTGLVRSHVASYWHQCWQFAVAVIIHLYNALRVFISSYMR